MIRIQAMLVASLIAAVLLVFDGRAPTPAARKADSWPHRVLITNDDGINEDRLWPLARAFAERIQTWVVASTEDRSGSSNYTFVGKYHRALTVQRVHQQKNLTAYAVPGYPADCVAFGILGPMKDHPPDLVISGVNGGPNLGLDGWFGSGTLGAARTAAYFGIPAIAVSGLDDDDREMVAKVSQWVVELAESSVARSLEPGEYLTIAVPRLPAGKIRGIRVAPRMPAVERYELERVLYQEDGDESEEVWVLKSGDMNTDVPPNTDGPLYRQGYIIVTPMKLGEDDTAGIAALRNRLDDLPPWPGKE